MLLRQHYTHKIFSCAMLFRASQTTLHRIFICAILSQEYLLGQPCRGKILCSVFPEAPDNVNTINVLIPLGQQYIGSQEWTPIV